METKLSWRSVVLPSGIQDLIPSQRVGAFKALDHARDMVDFLEVGERWENPGALVSLVCNSAGRVQDSVVTRICQTNELVCDFTDLVTMACHVSSFPDRSDRPSHKTYFVPIRFNWMWLFCHLFCQLRCRWESLQLWMAINYEHWPVECLGTLWIGEFKRADPTGWLIGDDKPSQYGWTDEFICGWSLER